MKKIITFIAGIVLAGVLACSAADRDHTLKIYNWADYIDEDLLEEFKDWYKEQTGEEIDVIYQLFDINEVMLSKIELGHEDFDAICPSDYIIERMLRKDLLLPIPHDFGDAPDWIAGSVSPFIKALFDMVDGNGKNANDYAVGYMWGTTGFLFNTKYIDRSELTSWNALANPKFAGKLYVKDAFRDIYCPILMYLKHDDIVAGKVTRQELMSDASDESIALVENYMKSIRDNVAGWEADFGKEEMTKEKAWLNMTWSGDSEWAIEEAADVGVSLDYIVPDEGSNVWFDGWCIPRYAKNVKAASYFIDFMCKPENALRNMDAIGYVSTIGGPDILDAMQDSTEYEPVDASYFFGEGAEHVYLNPVMYPDKSVIDRCALMHDSGDRTEAMLAMWTRIKGDSANSFTYILVFGGLGVILVAMIVGKISKVRKRNKRLRKKSHKRRRK